MENLTISLDEDVLRRAIEIASARNTSLNELVREYLERLVTESGHNESRRAQALEEIRKLHREHRGELGPFTWTREDLYER